MEHDGEPVSPKVGGQWIQSIPWLGFAAGILLLLLATGFYLWRSGIRLEDLASLGYPGVFLVMFISGSTVLLPAPGHATVLAGGALWNPFLVGLAAGLGNATGELVGYAAGRAGAAALATRDMPRWWAWLHKWLERYGFFAILIMATVPNPLFDVVGILAGSLDYPARRFWLACAIGNSIKYLAIAYLGDAARLLLR